MTSHKVTVGLADRSYPVVVGSGVSKEIDNFIPRTAKRAVIVTQESIPFSIKLSLPHTTVLMAKVSSSNHCKRLRLFQNNLRNMV
jgi:3-dehydroquinate synthetase